MTKKNQNSSSCEATAPVPRVLGIDERPVIILGMHRSGTTMLSRLLNRVGVFMGHDLTRNHESVFFQRLNKDALDFFGCSWAEVRSLPSDAELWDDFSSFRANTRRVVIETLLDGHFGPKHLRAAKEGMCWGWKDPRTCLTLPILLPLFPKARALYIERAPEDAALSLVIRDRSRYDRPQSSFLDRERTRFQEYVALWNEYSRRARAVKPHALTWVEVRYEDFVESPELRLGEILTRLDLPLPAKSTLREITADIRSDRKSSFWGREGEPFRDLIPARSARPEKPAESWSRRGADGSMGREVAAP